MEKDNLIDHVKFNYHMTTKHIFCKFIVCDSSNDSHHLNSHSKDSSNVLNFNEDVKKNRFEPIILYYHQKSIILRKICIHFPVSLRCERGRISQSQKS